MNTGLIDILRRVLKATGASPCVVVEQIEKMNYSDRTQNLRALFDIDPQLLRDVVDELSQNRNQKAVEDLREIVGGEMAEALFPAPIAKPYLLPSMEL